MKKYFPVVAVFLILFSSCGRKSDFVVDLAESRSFYEAEVQEGFVVIINKNSRTFHLDADCSFLSRMAEENRMELYLESLDKLWAHGYQACGKCSEKIISENNILS